MAILYFEILIDYYIHQIVYKTTIDNSGRKIAVAQDVETVNVVHVKVWGAEDELPPLLFSSPIISAASCVGIAKFQIVVFNTIADR